MKQDVTPIVKMEQEALKHLVKEVKGSSVVKKLRGPKAGRNSIRVVDMWNIHRKKRATHSLIRNWAI